MTTQVNEIASAPASYREDPYVRESLSRILRQIEASLDEPPLRLKNDVDAVVTSLSRLRDHLIAVQRRRQETSFVQSPTLERVNVALSLVISVGYPGGAIQREALQQAYGLLQEFLGE